MVRRAKFIGVSLLFVAFLTLIAASNGLSHVQYQGCYQRFHDNPAEQQRCEDQEEGL